MLERVRIVLVETTHPGNIGSAARAMKNMGLCELYLVKPLRFPHGEATALASGADDILERAIVVDQLSDALGDCEFILGTSARQRTLPWPLVTASQAAQTVVQDPRKTAIVFGREHSGLTNEELALCHWHVWIPTVENFSSLNLAAAVQVISYALREAWLNSQTDAPRVQPEPMDLASGKELEGFFEHLQGVLYEVGFLSPEHPKRLMHRLRRLFQRAGPDRTEINILRGILSAVEKRLR